MKAPSTNRIRDPNAITMSMWVNAIGLADFTMAEKAVLWAATLWADNQSGVLYPSLRKWARAASLRGGKRSLRRVLAELHRRGMIAPLTNRAGGRLKQTTHWRMNFDAINSAQIDIEAGDPVSPVAEVERGDTMSPVESTGTGDRMSERGTSGPQRGTVCPQRGTPGPPNSPQRTPIHEHSEINSSVTSSAREGGDFDNGKAASLRAMDGCSIEDRKRRFEELIAYAVEREGWEKRDGMRFTIDDGIAATREAWPTSSDFAESGMVPDADLFHQNKWAALTRLFRVAHLNTARPTPTGSAPIPIVRLGPPPPRTELEPGELRRLMRVAKTSNGNGTIANQQQPG